MTIEVLVFGQAGANFLHKVIKKKQHPHSSNLKSIDYIKNKAHDFYKKRNQRSSEINF